MAPVQVAARVKNAKARGRRAGKGKPQGEVCVFCHLGCCPVTSALIAAASSPQDWNAEQHVDAAQQALQQDDFKQAIRHYRRASELDPQVNDRKPPMLLVLDAVHALPRDLHALHGE